VSGRRWFHLRFHLGVMWANRMLRTVIGMTRKLRISDFSSRLLTMTVLIGLASCGGTGQTTTPSTTDETTVGPSPTVDETTSTGQVGGTTSTPSVSTSTAIELLDRAVAVFDEWVGAVEAGETDRAWHLMAPTSQLALGSRERFAEMQSGMAEGWGSWAAVEDPAYIIEEDEAGRILLVVSGMINPEGRAEEREVGVPIVEAKGELLVSPFEEFGNVAEGLEEETAGVDDPPVPPESGEGRRIVYSNAEQRVWLVESDRTVEGTFLVSGKLGVPAAGTYEVFSKSEVAFAGHDDITMSHMVRFAHGENLPIGFHAIPNDGNGRPLQTEEELGEYRSAGCIRQSPGHAAALYEWATVGTRVVVLP
jgi:hypothetical protein